MCLAGLYLARPKLHWVDQCGLRRVKLGRHWYPRPLTSVESAASMTTRASVRHSRNFSSSDRGSRHQSSPHTHTHMLNRSSFESACMSLPSLSLAAVCGRLPVAVPSTSGQQATGCHDASPERPTAHWPVVEAKATLTPLCVMAWETRQLTALECYKITLLSPPTGNLAYFNLTRSGVPRPIHCAVTLYI